MSKFQAGDRVRVSSRDLEDFYDRLGQVRQHSLDGAVVEIPFFGNVFFHNDELDLIERPATPPREARRDSGGGGMTMDRMTYEREMNAGFFDFRDGKKPHTLTGPYSDGYRAARAIYARNPKRFLVGYKPQGIGPKKPANTNIRIVSEEFERQMSRANARAAWSALR